VNAGGRVKRGRGEGLPSPMTGSFKTNYTWKMGHARRRAAKLSRKTKQFGSGKDEGVVGQQKEIRKTEGSEECSTGMTVVASAIQASAVKQRPECFPSQEGAARGPDCGRT